MMKVSIFYEPDHLTAEETKEQTELITKHLESLISESHFFPAVGDIITTDLEGVRIVERCFSDDCVTYWLEA